MQQFIEPSDTNSASNSRPLIIDHMTPFVISCNQFFPFLGPIAPQVAYVLFTAPQVANVLFRLRGVVWGPVLCLQDAESSLSLQAPRPPQSFPGSPRFLERRSGGMQTGERLALQPPCLSASSNKCPGL
mmetsp:Transcript_3071/g.4969  ORF Transcript_3071/g.4969 Transcript_3071/m.4969 type:complete len:129 (-) Transcript_3071:2076-2462(-)